MQKIVIAYGTNRVFMENVVLTKDKAEPMDRPKHTNVDIGFVLDFLPKQFLVPEGAAKFIETLNGTFVDPLVQSVLLNEDDSDDLPLSESEDDDSDDLPISESEDCDGENDDQ